MGEGVSGSIVGALVGASVGALDGMFGQVEKQLEADPQAVAKNISVVSVPCGISQQSAWSKDDAE